MRNVRVQVLLEPIERERFARAAARCGLSLSSWLRQAGLERLEAASASDRTESVAELEEFFHACGDREAQDAEPSWEEHQRVIDASRGAGSSGT